MNQFNYKPLINTNQGLLSLDEFAPSTKPISEAGIESRLNLVRKQTVRKPITLYTNDGMTLTLGETSQMLTIRDGELCYREVKDLKVNDLCVYHMSYLHNEGSGVPLKVRGLTGQEFYPKTMNKDLAWLLGVFYSMQVPMADNETELLYEFPSNMLLEFLNVKDIAESFFGMSNIKFIHSSDKLLIKISDALLKQWLKAHSLLIDKNYRELVLPKIIRKSSVSIVESFCSGMQRFSSQPKVVTAPYTHPSKVAMQQLAALLRAEGKRINLRFAYDRKLKGFRRKQYNTLRYYGIKLKSKTKSKARTSVHMHNPTKAFGEVGINPYNLNLHWDSIRSIYKNKKPREGLQLAVNHNFVMDGFVFNTNTTVCI